MNRDKGLKLSNSESSLIPVERRNRIHEIIRNQGIVRVAQLSKLLDVTEITIRRDLELLEKQNILERTHGGAIHSHHMRREPLYSDKHALHQDEKRAIGAAAAALVKDGDTLLVNSGSTTLQIFRHLSGRNNLRVITSSAGAFLETQGLDLELILTGGIYREPSHSLVGPLTTLSLQQVNGRKCFIGVDGISRKYGLTNPLMLGAETARTVVEQTHGQVIVVADHSKLGVVANYMIAPIEKIDILVTDSGFNESYRKELEELGIEIVVASG